MEKEEKDEGREELIEKQIFPKAKKGSNTVWALRGSFPLFHLIHPYSCLPCLPALCPPALCPSQNSSSSSSSSMQYGPGGYNFCFFCQSRENEKPFDDAIAPCLRSRSRHRPPPCPLLYSPLLYSPSLHTPHSYRISLSLRHLLSKDCKDQQLLLWMLTCLHLVERVGVLVPRILTDAPPNPTCSAISLARKAMHALDVLRDHG